MASPFESLIPFIALFVIPYMFLYVLIPLAMVLLWDKPILPTMIWTLIFANISASIFWYLVPNGVKRRKRKERGVFVQLVNWVYKIDDDDTNGFPSAHVYAPLITAYFVGLAYPAWGMLFVFAAVLVAASTIFIKQHYIVDVFGGWGWFWGSIYLTSIIF